MEAIVAASSSADSTNSNIQPRQDPSMERSIRKILPNSEPKKEENGIFRVSEDHDQEEEEDKRSIRTSSDELMFNYTFDTDSTLSVNSSLRTSERADDSSVSPKPSDNLRKTTTKKPPRKPLTSASTASTGRSSILSWKTVSASSLSLMDMPRGDPIIPEGNKKKILMALKELAFDFESSSSFDKEFKTSGAMHEETKMAPRQQAEKGDSSDEVPRDIQALATAAALNDIGHNNEKMSQYHKAAQSYSQSLSICHDMGFSSDHALVQDNINRLSVVNAMNEAMKFHEAASNHEKKGNYGTALKAYTVALEMKKKAFGRAAEAEGADGEQVDVQHPSIASSLRDIGVVHWKLGAYNDSLNALFEAISIYEDTSTPSNNDMEAVPLNQLDFAETLNSIGNVRLSLGQYTSAMKYFKRALSVLKDIYGWDHPQVAKTLLRIGTGYETQGKEIKAMKNYQHALQIQKKTLNDVHVDIAATLNRIGVVHEKWGEYTDALVAFNEALWIYRSALGDEHVDVGVTLNNLGQICRHLGQYDEAMNKYCEALRITEKALGSDHRNVATTLHNIGVLYMLQHEHDKALELFHEALVSQRAALGDEHADVATTLQSLGDVYDQMGKYEKALRFYQRSLDIRKTALGEQHRLVAVTLTILGKFAMDKMKRKHEAQRFFNDALKIFRYNKIPVNNPMVQDVVQSMKKVYSCKGTHRSMNSWA